MAQQGFNIDDFKANFQDLARAYTFMVMIEMPFDTSFNTEQTKYLVNSTTIPSSTIEEIEINWQGNVFPVGGTHTFADWTVTFRLDRNANLRNDFLEWHKRIHNPETNIHGIPSEYMQDEEIWQLDAQGEVIKKMQLVNAWPSEIGEISLDYGTKEFVTFDVTFKYLYYKLMVV